MSFCTIEIDADLARRILIAHRAGESLSETVTRMLDSAIPSELEAIAPRISPPRAFRRPDAERGALSQGDAAPASTENDCYREDYGNGWNGKGTFLPNGTQARMWYAGVFLTASIEGGRWRVSDKLYSDPSPAAGAAVAHGVKDRNGRKPPSLNGWKYWEVKRHKDQNWIPLSSLRGKDPMARAFRQSVELLDRV